MSLSALQNIEELKKMLETVNVYLLEPFEGETGRTALMHIAYSLPWLLAEPPSQPVYVYVNGYGRLVVIPVAITREDINASFTYASDNTVLHKYSVDRGIVYSPSIIAWISYPVTGEVPSLDVEKLSPRLFAVYSYISPLTVPLHVLEEIASRVRNLETENAVAVAQAYRALVEGAKQLGWTVRPDYCTNFLILDEEHLVQVPAPWWTSEELSEMARPLLRLLRESFSEPAEYRIHYIPYSDRYIRILTPRRPDTKLYFTVPADEDTFSLVVVQTPREELRRAIIEKLATVPHYSLRDLLDTLIMSTHENEPVEFPRERYSLDMLLKKLKKMSRLGIELSREDIKFVVEGYEFLKKLLRG